MLSLFHKKKKQKKTNNLPLLYTKDTRSCRWKSLGRMLRVQEASKAYRRSDGRVLKLTVSGKLEKLKTCVYVFAKMVWVFFK